MGYICGLVGLIGWYLASAKRAALMMQADRLFWTLRQTELGSLGAVVCKDFTKLGLGCLTAALLFLNVITV